MVGSSLGPWTGRSESGPATGDMGRTILGSISGSGAAGESSARTPGRSRRCPRCPRRRRAGLDFSAGPPTDISSGGRAAGKVEIVLLLSDCGKIVESVLLYFF